MASITGQSAVRAYFAAAPKRVTAILRAAGRAGGNVIADEVKRNTTSDAVRNGVRVRVRAEEDRIVIRIDVKPGWARSLGTWLEYGTAPHFISVDDSQHEGMGLRRINRKVKDAEGNHSLVIAGKFVGKTVAHPGARPHPVFRPAIDTQFGAAMARAQATIDTRLARGGFGGASAGAAGGDGE